MDLQDRIKRAYSADLFMMLERLEDKHMTAQEVLQRKQEQLQQLGPVVQRLQFEFLRKIIERVYNILDRAGVLPWQYPCPVKYVIDTLYNLAEKFKLQALDHWPKLLQLLLLSLQDFLCRHMLIFQPL